MNDQQQALTVNPLLQLEIIPEDAQQQDIGDVAEASQNMIDYLTRNGCTLTPTYTGRMGGPIYDIVVHAYHIIHSNEELLAAMFASLAATLSLIRDHNKPAPSGKTALAPSPMTVIIDLPTKEGPLTIKAPDAETAIQLIEHLRATQPEKMKHIIPQRKTTIKVSIPRQKWRLQN